MVVLEEAGGGVAVAAFGVALDFFDHSFVDRNASDGLS